LILDFYEMMTSAAVKDKIT